MVLLIINFAEPWTRKGKLARDVGRSEKEGGKRRSTKNACSLSLPVKMSKPFWKKNPKM